jgi:hypothetical protein
MDCVICADLERDFDLRRAEYIEALSAAHYRVSSTLAASKNVDMELAKSFLDEHQLICSDAVARPATNPVKDRRGRVRERAVRLGAVVETYGQWLLHPYQYTKGVLGHRSASFLQSLTTALVLGATAAFIGVAASAALYYRHIAWYISAAAGPLVDTLVVVCLATIALEQSRKRSIRRTLELSFLNHHVHNALTQMIMAAELTDADKQDRYMREAVSRISEALFRVANSAEIAELSLEVDVGGAELIRAREAREKQWDSQNIRAT